MARNSRSSLARRALARWRICSMLLLRCSYAFEKRRTITIVKCKHVVDNKYTNHCSDRFARATAREHALDFATVERVVLVDGQTVAYAAQFAEKFGTVF